MPSPSKQPTPQQLAPVKSAILSLLSQPLYDDGTCGPILVRLAWHASGTYCATTKTGGSSGAGMRWEREGGDPANAGLSHARAFLEPVKKLYPWITYSDLWTLAAVVAIEAMGGPVTIPWQGGRSDFVSEEGAIRDETLPPRGRLPDGARGTAEHLREVFGRMGLGSSREIVALSGAHNLGRCHRDRSGFEGKWVNNPTRFSNQYFRLLLGEKWVKREIAGDGKEAVVQFNSYQGKGDEEEDGEDGDAAEEGEEEEEEPLMMLPTDMALLEDKEFRFWVEKYAEDNDLFFEDFATTFGKLLELGVKRDGEGVVVDGKGVEEGYRSAPKKSDEPAKSEGKRSGCPKL